MTYLIIGLGNFGIALAKELSALGHDVFGVDSNMKLVEEYKDTFTSTICVNLTDTQSIKALPIDDADKVIVALGDNVGDSVIVTSLFKKVGVNDLIVRAINPVHETILYALGVDEIIAPERMAANIWAVTTESNKIIGVYHICDTHQIIEFEIPSMLIGKSLAQANLEAKFAVKIVAVKRRCDKTNFLGKTQPVYNVVNADENFKFADKDRVVLYGVNKAMMNYKKQMI